VSLLPPTYTPEVARALTSFAPDLFCLTDHERCNIDLPRLAWPVDLDRPGDVQGPGDLRGRDLRGTADLAPTADPGGHGEGNPIAREPWRVPELETSQLAAVVFTSGSTGQPVPHPKTWGKLLRCVRDGAERLGLAAGGYAVLATVPPQHMYGFESSVLIALQGASALCAEHPFYPADICAALESLPRPRALVSTPLHLRAVLSSAMALPPVDLIVCATAPLSAELARESEQRLHAPLIEIYGSTESGQLATRRSAREREWRLWPGVCLTLDEGRTWARGGHLEQPTPMCDELEVIDGERFLLHGRLADLVNIAGKRSSLAYLTHQLTAIEGVRDGAFFFPQEPKTSASGVTRVAAVVVAPGLTAAQVLAELRQRIDPVFLPRPLILTERLPRNSTGKLPATALRALATASPGEPG
jgi:acyl-coenzyme A synthetase/AMP-(fatty) acid ligase